MKSGRFVVRISPQLHQTLIEQAQSRGISLNDICVERLSVMAQDNSNQEKLFINLNTRFFGLRLLGIVKLNQKAFIFLEPTHVINALLYWDFEEAVIEKLNFRLEVQFLNMPENLNKMSYDLSEALVMGQILFDQNGELLKLSNKIKKTYLIQQLDNKSHVSVF